MERDTMEHNHFYEGVKAFHKAFNHPVGEKPTVMNAELALKRAVWSAEELVEFLHQTSKDEVEFLKLIADFKVGIDAAVEKSLGNPYPETDEERLVGQADALTDELYFNQGSFVLLGVEPTPLFDIVQQANMAKLGADGKPIIRESDGKIMKPEGWEENWAPEPKLRAEVQRQSQQ